MRSAPHPFTLRQLQYAVAVADELSFRAAAQRCHVSQPSLSAQIAEIERSLGVRLFERDRRRVLVTPAGAEVLDRARRLLLGADDLTDAAERSRDPLAGALRVGIIPTISPYLLPAVVPALRRRFPRLALRWTEDKTDALVRALESGELDGAVVALEADLGDVEREVIALDPFVLAAPPKHALAVSSKPVAASSLHDARFLLLDEGHCFRDQALAYCSTAETQELDFRATSLSTLAQMVSAGAGVTLLPALAVPTESRRSNVAIRPFARPAPHRTLAMVWRRGSPLGGALREVAGAIRGAYPNPPASKR